MDSPPEQSIVKAPPVKVAIDLDSPPSLRDTKRWGAWKSGVSPEELADREGVDVSLILASILKREAANKSFSNEIVQAKVNEVVLDTLGGFPVVFKEAMEAKKLLAGYGPNGEDPILEADHDMRLKVVGEVRELIKATQPKGNGVVINNQNNSATLIQNSGGNQTKGFESIVREVRASQGLTNEAIGDDLTKVYDPTKDAGFVDETAEEDEEDDEDDELEEGVIEGEVIETKSEE